MLAKIAHRLFIGFIILSYVCFITILTIMFSIIFETRISLLTSFAIVIISTILLTGIGDMTIRLKKQNEL